ncbi:MAG: caspase family protein [Rhodospirillales bacterium]|nr:caspase family protein [Rhodospirillales bacterium]
MIGGLRLAARALAALLLATPLLLAPGLASAPAATPPAAPFLRLDPPGHIGAIPSLSVDAAGTLLATASYDKTIRLWSLPDGIEREVLRPPIGPGREGEIWAVALTPSGRRIFAAGATGGTWDGTFSIYLFSVATGRLVARLPGLPSPVMALAVSPDGTRLAAGLAVGGIRVWDAHTGHPLFADPAYRGLVRNLAFDRRNRLYTTASDGQVRAYAASGRLIAALTPHPGSEPWGLAVSPDGGLIAITFVSPRPSEAPPLEVLHTPTLRPAYTPDTSGLAGQGLLAVTWAADSLGGVRLLAGGYARSGRAMVIRSWGDYGLGSFENLPAATDTILALAAVPGGGAAYGTADPGWGLIAPTGRLALSPHPPMADLRPARHEMLRVSADGSRVLFAIAPRTGKITFAGPARPPRLALFNARAETLCLLPRTPPAPAASSRGIRAGCASPSSALAGLASARLTAPGLTVTDWKNTNAPRLNGRPLALARAEFSRSLAILPNGRALLLGTDSHLRLFAPTGRQIAALPIPAPAWAVTVSANSRVAVAALLDGTLRWYGLGQGTRLSPRATLFVAQGTMPQGTMPQGTMHWVLYTPEGLFDASGQGGDRLVGFEFDRGADQPPAWVSFSEAFRLFYAPRAVRARLLGNPAPARARLAELGPLRLALLHRPKARVIAACLPEPASACRPLPFRPTATLEVPAKAKDLRLTLSLSSRGLHSGPIDLFVNGRNAGRFPPPAPPAAATTVATEKVLVPLDPGPDQVALRIYNRSATIFSTTPTLDLARTGAAPPLAKGSLYILAVGIDHFAAPSLTLRYAAPDARTFARLMQLAAAPLYPHIETTLLLNAEATRAGILSALKALAREIRPEDTFLLYIASHGAVSPTDGQFLLAPSDLADLSSWQAIEKGAIDQTTLIGALAAIRARDALLFIDTCYSGKLTADALANVSHEVGRYVISASSSVQEALDSYNNKNGLMVYALRQALDGEAPHGPHGVIGALSLGEYLSERIAALARRRGHKQTAEFKAAQRDLISFPVAEILPPTPAPKQP